MGSIIQRVRIQAPAPSNSSWPRSLSFHVGGKSFGAPSRIISSQILSAKALLGSKVPLEGDIGVIDRGGLNKEKLTKLLSVGGPTARNIREIRKHDRRLNHTPLRILYMYPTMFDGERIVEVDGKKQKETIPSGFSLTSENEAICLRFAEYLKEVMLYSGCQTLGVPTISKIPSIQEKVFRSALNDLDRGVLSEAIPVIDMRQPANVVEHHLNYLIDEYFRTGIIRSIAFHNSFSSLSLPTRALISQKIGIEPILTLIFSINRVAVDGITSGVQTQSVRFGDAFSPRYVPHYISDLEESESYMDPYEPPFFNSRNRKIDRTIGNGSDLDIRTLSNEMRGVFGEDYYFVDRVVQAFIENPSVDEVTSRLSATSKVHEHVLSSKEVKFLDRKITEGSFDEYVKLRPELFVREK